GPASSQSAVPVAGSAPSPKIAGWSPPRSTSRAPDRLARTSAHAAANTDVPEPPFGDQSVSRGTPGSLRSVARARDGRKEEVRGEKAHPSGGALGEERQGAGSSPRC